MLQKILPWRAMSFCLLAATKLALSQTIVWQPTGGPSAGTVHAVAINTSRDIFAGTEGGGVYRSMDNGANWTAVNMGLASLDVRALAINSSGHLWAGTNGSGVFFSTNSGASWTAANSGLTNAFVRCLAINASNHIFAGTLFGGIFRSTDNGVSWTVLNTGLVNTAASALAINARGHVFAGTAAGMLRSTDNGNSWTPLNAGLTTRDVRALVINPMTQMVFAGTGGDGAFRLFDNGSSWAEVNSGLTIRGNYALALNSSGYIFAGGSGGIFRSPNDGGSWTAINSSLTDTDVRSLAINASGHIWAGTVSGMVFRSAQPTTAVQELADDLPASFSLEQNYPNPFSRETSSSAFGGGRPATTIQFSLPHDAFVTLKVYNILGEEMATLAAEKFPAGKHRVHWNADADNFIREIRSGVYFYRLQAGDIVQMKKLILLE